MRRSVLSVLLAFSMSGWASDNPLVFIHGIKGSLLSDPSGKIVWMTGWQTLGLSTPDLRLPLSWEGNVQKKDTLTPAGVFAEVTIVPWLFSPKVYGPWLTAAPALGPFHAFSYDWRRDNLETVEKFEAFLTPIVAATGKKATVVAHSMGGLITLALLNRRPDLFHSVVFVGVPFIGGIGFLPDLHVGTADGFNRKLLAPDVVGSFTSVYSFFPDGAHDRTRDREGNAVPVDFYSIEGWRKYGLGFFRASAKPNPDVEGFLPTALTRAKAFRAELVKKDVSYPPILVVLGRTHPTLSHVIQNGPKAVDGWDFDSAPREPGDGRVRASYALPPTGIPYETFESEASHAHQLNDPKVIERIRSFSAK